MKSIFDKCKFGDFKLNSRIIRTGLWESQQKDLNAIYGRYDKIASSGVGLITSELFSIYPKDKFIEHSQRMDSTISWSWLVKWQKSPTVMTFRF